MHRDDREIVVPARLVKIEGSKYVHDEVVQTDDLLSNTLYYVPPTLREHGNSEIFTTHPVPSMPCLPFITRG